MSHPARSARRANEARRRLVAHRQRPRTPAEQEKSRGERAARDARTFWTGEKVRAYYAAWNRTGRAPSRGAEVIL